MTRRYAAEVLAGRAPGRGAAAAGRGPDPADPVFRYLGGEFTLPSRDAPSRPAAASLLPVMAE